MIDVLVTGASGVVGTELMRRLVDQPGIRAVGCSASGQERRGVVAWAMGQEPAPPELRDRRWDVVVHAAARTRWTQTVEEAANGNIGPAGALAEVVRDDTHLVFLSTAHAVGLDGDDRSDDPATFRNAYEWSKVQAEVVVEGRHPSVNIVRFPMVTGRRSDGAVARFSGFYQVLSGITSGLLPAFVGLRDAPVDFVPVDDIAEFVLHRVLGKRPGVTDTLGCGADAPRASEVLDETFQALNDWRVARGIDPVEQPPLLDPERWDRFYLPFAREHLSPLQLQAIELFSVFHPYMAMTEPFVVTEKIVDPMPAFARSVKYWADQRSRAASAIPQPWQ